MVSGDDKSQLNGGDPVGMELRESVETVARVRRSMFEGVWDLRADAFYWLGLRCLTCLWSSFGTLLLSD